MSDLFSPAEIRYYVISFIGLLLITSMLTAAGMADEAYDPPEPEVDESVNNTDQLAGTTTFFEISEGETLYIDENEEFLAEVTDINEEDEEVSITITDERGAVDSPRSMTLSEGESNTVNWASPSPASITTTLEVYDSSNPGFQFSSDNVALDDVDEEGVFGFGVLGSAMDSASNTFGLVLSLFEAWYIVLSQAGWASAFVLAPMTVMSMVLANGLLKVTYVLATAIPL